MNGMFCQCVSLKSLPDISKWKTSNVKDMKGIFYNCNSLISMPDISKWNITKVDDMDLMLYGLKNTIKIPEFYILSKSKNNFIYDLTYRKNKDKNDMRILGKDL